MDGSQIERFESMWSRVIETFATHRPLWVASFEAFVQSERSPELRAQLADGYERSRLWMASRLLQIDDAAVPDRAAHAVGSLLLALQAGLAAQWLLDPERSPTAGELTEAMGTIFGVAGARSPRREPSRRRR
jgi:hypothetical protein